MLQSSDLETGSKPTATATGDITSDTGGQLGQSALEFEDLLGHHGDGLRRSDYNPVISDGGKMNPGRIPSVMIQVGTNNISRSSDEEEALWESMMVCLFTTLWQKFNCAVLTICTVPMNERSLTSAGRRHSE